MHTPAIRRLAAVLVVAVVLAACGDDDTTAAPPGASEGGDRSTDDAPVSEADTDLGAVLVDAGGLTLYGFLPDEGGTPTCVDDCASTWPPLVVEGESLPADLDTDLFAVVERPDGARQLAAGGWPLYTFAADEEPGDVTGQGVGGNWFAVSPDGTLIDEGAEATTTSAGRPGY